MSEQGAADETTRVRRVYAGRTERLAGGGAYSLTNDAYLFAIQGRQRALLRLLRDEGLWPLAGKDILEVGCGNGGVLLELLSYGADPQKLHGADLLAERAAVARQRLPHLPISAASGTASRAKSMPPQPIWPRTTSGGSLRFRRSSRRATASPVRR